MKVIDHILKTKHPNFSYEILPPIKGENINHLFDIVTQLKSLNPAWINVTSHASTLIHQNDIHGNLINKVHKKRPGTISICGAIQNKFGIDAVAHILCSGFSKEETENALIELNYLGVENVLALRGDTLNYDKTISNKYSINYSAAELTNQINSMRFGKFLDNTDYTALDFCIGVAGYPEKHTDAPNLDTDIKYLKQKVENGASYIVTQMFFDNKYFFEFVNKCRLAGINVPIIPGIKILKNEKQLTTIPKLFNINIPPDLVNEIRNNPEYASVIGKKWAIHQIQDLIKHNINNIHFFIMNDIAAVVEVTQNL